MDTDHRSFDSFAHDYDRFKELAPDPDWITRLRLAGGRALDAGCGTGHHTIALAETFDDVLGIDISEPMLDIARAKRSRPNIRYETSDLTTYRDPDGFDLVWSAATLHHVPNLDAALANLRDLTRPGGTVVCVDLVSSLWWRLAPRLVHAVGHVLDFPQDVRRVGVRQALWMARFRFGPWRGHVTTDRFLSWDEFVHAYGASFPGARFERRGFAACIWTKP